MKGKTGAGRLFIRFALLALNALVVLWLGICFSVAYVSPERSRYLSLFTLTIPFAVFANFVFVGFWLFTNKKLRSLISLLGLIIFYKTVLLSFGWNFFSRNDMSGAPNRIKIMTWNVHGMGAFDKPISNTKDKEIIDFITEEAPDILCLPEFYTLRTNALNPYSSRIVASAGYKEFRFQKDNSIGTLIWLGTGIFSKYPISSFKATPLAKYVYAVQADFKVSDSLTIRGFFLHLQSVRLSDKDKALIEDVKKREQDIGIDKSRNILSRLSLAYVYRAEQARLLRGLIEESPYPVIVCGDMNDLPGSYAYTKIKGEMKDAFSEKGKGFGRTYNLFAPTLRIDYILYTPTTLGIVGVKHRNVSHLSDHNPVIANFEILPLVASKKKRINPEDK